MNLFRRNDGKCLARDAIRHDEIRQERDAHVVFDKVDDGLRAAQLDGIVKCDLFLALCQ